MKKCGFSIIFAENSPKSFKPDQYRRSNAAKQKSNGSSKQVCRKGASKLATSVGIEECRICIDKVRKVSFLLTKTCRNIFWQKL